MREQFAIAMTIDPTTVHRGPYDTEGEALDWLSDWYQDGGKDGVFLIISREVGEWEVAY